MVEQYHVNLIATIAIKLFINVNLALLWETFAKIAKLLVDVWENIINWEKNNAIKGNDAEELSKMQRAIEGGFDATELERDINFLNLASDLNNKAEIHREFIKHFNNDNAKECPVTISQDKHFSDV